MSESTLRIDQRRKYGSTRKLVDKACETDDLSLLREAFSAAPSEDLEYLQQNSLAGGLYNGSNCILGYLLINSFVSVEKLPPSQVVRQRSGLDVSQATLELLLAHGWDINHFIPSQHRDSQPFTWLVVRNYALVKWALEHGADVHPRNYQPWHGAYHSGDQCICESILEVAACNASVATFELLRSHGAPLGRRTLHYAVEWACFRSSSEQKGLDEKDDEQQSSATPDSEPYFGPHEERMAMVRHLIDVVRLDVNAPDKGPGKLPAPRWGPCVGTPICYIPDSHLLGRGTRDITWLLLDRGADPVPALHIADEAGRYPEFREDVEAWKKMQKSKPKCCMQ